MVVPVTILGAIGAIRDDVIAPEHPEMYKLVHWLPDWRWQTYLLCIVLVVVFLILEGSYRAIEKRERDILKFKGDFSDETRSNVHSKVSRLSPEVKRDLYRIITAEIEADQLNVDTRSELERAGLIKPAFAYTPAEFIERYRPLIAQWFKRNPL